MLFFLLGLCSIILTGCIEIIDDLSINSDGSGTFKYTVNLSSSKVKVNSVLALDSLNGTKIPSKAQIEEMISTFKSTISKEPGISNVNTEVDMANFIIKINCDFKSVAQLQNAIKTGISSMYKHPSNELDTYNWVSWDDNTLVRSIPQLVTQDYKRLKTEDKELLKQGNYTSFTRFDKEIESFDNTKSQLSKNKKALMIRVDPNALMINTNLLTNRIKLEQ